MYVPRPTSFASTSFASTFTSCAMCTPGVTTGHLVKKSYSGQLFLLESQRQITNF